MNDNTYPSIAEALYLGNSIPEVVDIYSKELRKTGLTSCLSHATALQVYKATALNVKHLSKIRTLFNKTFQMLYGESSFDFTMEARRKSLLSTNNKVLKLQSESISLDTLRDFLGIIFIIYGNKSDAELVLNCYRLMELLYTFYSENGYILCESGKVKDTSNFDNSNFPDIFIPDKKSIVPYWAKFENCIKDYISHPKKNGYQSIHAIFRDSEGKFFEIQIRTLKQHIFAEAGDANHKVYKKDLYQSSKSRDIIDKTKIHIPGFAITPNGDTFDYVGLTKSLLIYHRQKTF